MNCISFFWTSQTALISLHRRSSASPLPSCTTTQNHAEKRAPTAFSRTLHINPTITGTASLAPPAQGPFRVSLFWTDSSLWAGSTAGLPRSHTIPPLTSRTSGRINTQVKCSLLELFRQGFLLLHPLSIPLSVTAPQYLAAEASPVKM